MARYKKKDYLAVVELLEQVNKRLAQQNLCSGDLPAVLSDCQEAAILLGTNLEQQGEEGVRLTHILEAYCESLYQLSERLAAGAASEVCVADIQNIDCQLAELKEGIRESLPERKEVVFLPYKASMWDSLESVWMAADKDPDCDAYVIPIPYYDKKPDGSFGEFHYEGKSFPEYVSITSYKDYSLEERMPDIVYIHNPYDQYNNATSIDPRFYSAELKKYTNTLVYVPYYATSGGMSEGQKLCSAYLHADYIVIQSEKYRDFFDENIPDEKFLPLGSPKFDRVIRLCNNPPEPPEAWKEKMEGKTVYFYNTSLGGMLGDTAGFLKKMEYVFHCFEGRKDSCLLWRPHPLLETTFDSMRKEYRPYFDRLKREFQKKNLGIYDDTPDIEKTIALSDVYIGDDGTSVTSLFGVVGKPLFIFNNCINSKPQEKDWFGEMLQGYFLNGQDDWVITRENQLFHAPNHDYRYEFYCDLSEYAGGNYYQQAIEIDAKVYVCPANAQDILVLRDHQIVERIELKHESERPGAFFVTWKLGKDLYLIPNQYPAIVRLDTECNRVEYLTGYNDRFVKMIEGVWKIGGSCIWNNRIWLASPNSNEVLAIQGGSLQIEEYTIPSEDVRGTMGMVPDGENIWLLPFEGEDIVRWRPDTGETQVYRGLPEDFQCKQRPFGYSCMERPFSWIAFSEEFAIISPYWGNMFLKLDKKTGKFSEWDPPFPTPEQGKNGYWYTWAVGTFLGKVDKGKENDTYRYFSYPERKLYDVNIDKGTSTEIPIFFDGDEVRNHEKGFCENSDWMQYCCIENAFCSLEDLLDGNLPGTPFDRERQLAAYAKITANVDGTCGDRIHETICRKWNVT